MTAKLVIAVDTVTSTDGRQVTAAAVVYPINEPEPVFEYQDGKGRTHKTRFLSNLARIPEHVRPAVVGHLRRASLSWAVVVRPAGQALEAEGLAVGRSIERLLHQRPEVVQNLNQDDLHIYLPDSRKIPTELVSLTPQVPKARSWRTGAAKLLALHRE